MGCVHSRTSRHTSPLTTITSFISSLAWHLSSLLDCLYDLLLYPILRLQGPRRSSAYSRHDGRWASAFKGGEADSPVSYRPGRTFQRKQEVERRRRRAAEAAEQATQTLLDRTTGGPAASAASVALDGEKFPQRYSLNGAGFARSGVLGRVTPEEVDAWKPLDTDGEVRRVIRAAKRRSAPPRYVPRATPTLLTNGPAPLLVPSRRDGTMPRYPMSPPMDPPMAKINIRAASSASPTAPQLTRPSPAFLPDEGNSRPSNKSSGEAERRGSVDARSAGGHAISPRPSLDVRRQAMAFSDNNPGHSHSRGIGAGAGGGESNLRLASFEAPSYSSLQLPPSRTSTGLSASTGGVEGRSPCSASPRTSISDLASAACSRKNAAKERKLWRDEIDKLAKRKVVTAAATGSGGSGGGGGVMSGGMGPGKRSSLAG